MTTATFDHTLKRSIERFKDDEQTAYHEYVRLLRKGEKLSDDDADRMFLLANQVLNRSPEDIQADRDQLVGDQSDRDTIKELDALAPELEAARKAHKKAGDERDKFLKSLKEKETKLRVDAAVAYGELNKLRRRINQKEDYEQRRAARRQKFPELMRAVDALASNE